MKQASYDGCVIKYHLPNLIEKKPIACINLLKDIQTENPTIYLTLKSKLRLMGLYNEEFSILSMVYRDSAGVAVS